MDQTEIEKVEAKSKKIKPLTLVSGIIGVIIGAALVALAFFVGYSLISAFWIKDTSSAGEALFWGLWGWMIIPLLLIISGLILVVAILNLVSGGLAIAAATKDDKKYLARKGLIVTSIVFDFLLVGGLAIFAMSNFNNTSSSDAATSLVFGIGAIVAFVSALIKIIDLAHVSKRYKKQVEIEKEQKKFEADHGTENKLAKYKEMLDSGVITQEEYNQLRAKELGLDKE